MMNQVILISVVMIGTVSFSTGSYYVPRPDPCSVARCGFGALCTVKDHKAVCVCNKACPKILRPVCGSDGKTYNNECLLRVASCEQQKEIKVVHQGRCNPCHHVKCGFGEICQVKNHKAVCVCNTICPEIYKPVCGSDGKTYSNECFMNVASCQQKKKIRVVHQGKCGTVCHYNYKTYKVGDSFIKAGCSARCTCQAGGRTACVTLCPPVAILCQRGYVVKYRQVPQGSGCFCRRPYCAPAKVCHYNYKTYKVGDSFIKADCTGRCTCQVGGRIACATLCPRVLIKCQRGYVVKYRQVPQGNGCFCRRPYCAKNIYTPY